MKHLATIAALAVALAAVRPAAAVDGWRIEPFEKDVLDTFMSGTDETAIASPVVLAAEACMIGAAGSTILRADMAERMKLMSAFDTTFAAIRESYERLETSNTASVALAPSIWSTKPRMFAHDYLHTLQDSFGAEAGVLLDASAVNAWTATVTEGRIPEILSAESASAIAAASPLKGGYFKMPETADVTLCCALSIEAAWPQPLPLEPAPTAFRNGDGTERPVRFAAGRTRAMRLTRPGFNAFVCPMASPGLRFIAILPDEGLTLADVRTNRLTAVSLEEIKASYRIGFGTGVEMGDATIRIPPIDATWQADPMPFLSRYGVPSTGLAAIDSGKGVLTKAVAAAAFKLDGRGITLTPGVAAKLALDAIDAAKGDTPSARRRRLEAEAAAAARVDFAIDLSRPFIFALWDEGSNTIPVLGECK